MPSSDDLENLLLYPNETPSVEHKSWLNLQDNVDRAKLVKAIVALANYGGGIVVLGMRPDNADGGVLESQRRPASIRRLSQDDVNGAVRRYADPSFHCELQFAVHPETGVEHAFVVVPADMSVPVITTRDCEGVMRQWRCYTRKPGPRSEEPQSAEEWRMLLDKCVRARREDMLDAIRTIVQGRAGVEPTPEAADALLEFATGSRHRWEALVETLPANDPARLQHGRYELSFEIVGAPPVSNLSALLDALNQAGSVRYTGWGPFVRLTRQPLEPRRVNGAIEAWIGALDAEGHRTRTAAHSDFWVAHPSGKLFTIRGYDEDSIPDVGPGTSFDLALPIWRVGETLLFVRRFASSLDDNPLITVRCHYFGLQGRELSVVARPRRRLLDRGRICHDSEAELVTQVSADQIEETLAEVIHSLLAPLYERFGFFQLPMELVVEELADLRGHRF